MTREAFITPSIIINLTLCFILVVLAVPADSNSELISACSTTSLTTDYDNLFYDETTPVSRPKKRGRELRVSSCVGADRLTSVLRADRQGSLNVDCGRCAVLDLDLKARSQGQSCWGLTPELLTFRHECIWKDKCQLQYSPSFMFYGQASCLAKWTSQIEMSTVCLNTVDNGLSDVDKTVQKVTSARGLVRSHFYYNNSKHNYPRSDPAYPPESTLTLSPPFPPTNSTILLLHFFIFDLAPSDQLSVLQPSLQCLDNWTKGGTYVVNTGHLPDVSLQFSIGQQYKKDRKDLAEGFEICFQWFSTGDVATVMPEFERTKTKCKRWGQKSPAPKYSDNPVYDVMRLVSTDFISGVLRSHPEFPWNYRRPTEVRVLGAVRNHVHELRAPSALSTLQMTIGSLSLVKGDNLHISNCNGTAFLAESGKTYNIVGDKVIINFTVQASATHTNGGFYLCYQWLPSGSSASSAKDVCKKLSLDVKCRKKRRQRIPEQCRTKKRKKKNKRRKRRRSPKRQRV